MNTGSGDEIQFNIDDSLMWIVDVGNNMLFFGINPVTLQTQCLTWQNMYGGGWSQTDRNFFYEWGGDGKLYKVDFTGCALGGGGTCTPVFTQIFNFITHCNVNPTIVFAENAGIGNSDLVFGGDFSPGTQDTGQETQAVIVTFNAPPSTGGAVTSCSNYDTELGTIRTFTVPPTLLSGRVTCDGSSTVTWASGQTFDNTSGGGIGWDGVFPTINGVNTYRIQSVASSTSMTLNTACPTTSGTPVAYSINPGTILGTTTSADRYDIHNVKLSPGGTWMIVIEGDSCFSGSCAIVHAWQNATTTVKNCTSYCDGHWTESATGWINSGSFTGDNAPSELYRTWAKFDTTNASVDSTELNTGGATLLVGFDVHQSNKNDPMGTHGYPILSSTYAPELPLGSIHYPYSNEVIGWKQSGGPVLRFGRTFNSSLAPASCCFPTEYAIGAPSSTGHFYAFTTDAEGTLGNSSGGEACSITAGSCRGDVFILDLASAPEGGGPPPPPTGLRGTLSSSPQH